MKENKKERIKKRLNRTDERVIDTNSNMSKNYKIIKL